MIPQKLLTFGKSIKYSDNVYYALMSLKNRINDFFIQRIYSKEHKKEVHQWEKVYGAFDKKNYDGFSLHGLPNESSFYFGEIIKWARDIIPRPKRTLLAGEDNKVVKYLQPKLQVKNVCTTGLLDVDYKWDFEENPPKIGQFDLIISQAILEHLLNPYKHMCDLVNLLVPNGFLIIHTVCPGHPYHRHPIDACRFYPDWFEGIAKRLNLNIIKKRIKDNKLNHIFYMYQKKY